MRPELMSAALGRACLMGTRIQLTIPAILAWGEEFTLAINVTDSNALPINAHHITLTFLDSCGVNGLPPECQIPAGETAALVNGLRALPEACAHIRAAVTCSGAPGSAPVVASNSCWLFEQPPYRLYFGDLHVHSELSNCGAWRSLSPEWCYEYARDVSRLDFLAVSDHLRGIAAENNRWTRLQQCARNYDAPGSFVSFLAYESSHAQGCGGDNNVYFLDAEAPYFWLERADMHSNSPAIPLPELWQQLEANGKSFFTVPHHTGRAHKYRHWQEPFYSPMHEPLFEIYSSWGSSETRHSALPISGGNNEEASYFDDALIAGTRFGVIASSDDHASLPGSIHDFRCNPFTAPKNMGHAHKGLAAVQASTLTRPALFNALRRRHCYGSTGARILLDLALDPAGQGDEISATAQLYQERRFRLRCTPHNAGDITAILLRNGREISRQSCSRPDLPRKITEMTFIDANPLEQTAVREAPFHPEPFTVYYIRLEDNNGNQAWSSPIWIDL